MKRRRADTATRSRAKAPMAACNERRSKSSEIRSKRRFSRATTLHDAKARRNDTTLARLPRICAASLAATWRQEVSARWMLIEAPSFDAPRPTRLPAVHLFHVMNDWWIDRWVAQKMPMEAPMRRA
eukprot:scaffold121408_cov30-Tisochrysis_lutea.AAC.5